MNCLYFKSGEGLHSLIVAHESGKPGRLLDKIEHEALVKLFGNVAVARVIPEYEVAIWLVRNSLR